MQPLRLFRNPMTWGAAALAVLTVVALVAAVLYASPPGQKTISFYTDDAASIRKGDQVRIAGIAVGKVKDIALEADRVRVQARIDDSAFVGDKSQIEVRMLTVVGGYYVNLVSLGDTPLGSNTIPLERVTMPYNLVRALNDTAKITENIDTKPINESLKQIQTGLNTGQNLETLNAVVDAGNQLMSTVDRQRGQITTILNLSDEYLEQLKDVRGVLEHMIEKIAIIQASLEIFSKGFGAALFGMGRALQALKPVGVFYDHHRAEVIEKMREFLAKGRIWINHNGAIVRGLRDIQRHIERVLDVQQAPPELLATDLCIPMPGSAC
ncbi:MCE family protein [Mycobacterium palustre]|nr:MCE family protein [Mycobacterium palustre]